MQPCGVYPYVHDERLAKLVRNGSECYKYFTPEPYYFQLSITKA